MRPDLKADWYNDFAAFTLALGNPMGGEASTGKRREILAALNETLSRN